MSCRVLKRGVEKFVLETIKTLARENECTLLKGEYIETTKNALVKNHYNALGFRSIVGNSWELNPFVEQSNRNYIQSKENG